MLRCRPLFERGLFWKRSDSGSHQVKAVMRCVVHVCGNWRQRFYTAHAAVGCTHACCLAALVLAPMLAALLLSFLQAPGQSARLEVTFKPTSVSLDIRAERVTCKVCG